MWGWRYLKLLLLIPDKTKRQREKERKEEEEKLALSALGEPGVTGFLTKEEMIRERGRKRRIKF
jgi:hypothetical protein